MNILMIRVPTLLRNY